MTTYRTIAIINAGNRRRFYWRLVEMILAIRDSSLNLVSISQGPDGRVRIVLSQAVSQAQLNRFLLEPHPSP